MITEVGEEKEEEDEEVCISSEGVCFYVIVEKEM